VHVEQIGWGVARQVARVLREKGVEDPDGILDRLPDVAEREGFLAYAVFEGRSATAAALVQLPEKDGVAATYAGEVLTEDASEGTHDALVARARHDAANAGVERLDGPI
jgi:hypothetical protein